ncbi:hypothetical protein [Actinoplanes awajinensis]|uniref:Copper chaperone PCu(A)C n=1 Tax=Actinoplanes awajinensis subsp. mycoplanecinus TaxID=135947 RepID=A0A117MNU3_9ACTN|nr:hypothetical protein [Actinoplanes awajinensis]KUL27595.1 hypothetical protein ADL15_34810 [Actinoplanes awajinensis subsp. mycoplanecinus]
MRSLGTRRAALVAGVATTGIIALAGCSAGQVAETAILNTPIAGVNAESADGSVFVRNAQVEYNGIAGYKSGANAPLELSLFNQTEKEVTVSITSAAIKQPQVVSAAQVGFVTEAPPVSAPAVSTSASVSASLEPSAPALPTSTPTPTVTAAQIKIAPLGSAVYQPDDAAKLQLIKLSDDLKPGEKVNLVFSFSNGAADLTIQAPVAVPGTPASRGPAAEGENTEHE